MFKVTGNDPGFICMGINEQLSFLFFFQFAVVELEVQLQSRLEVLES